MSLKMAEWHPWRGCNVSVGVCDVWTAADHCLTGTPDPNFKSVGHCAKSSGAQSGHECTLVRSMCTNGSSLRRSEVARPRGGSLEAPYR